MNFIERLLMATMVVLAVLIHSAHLAAAQQVGQPCGAPYDQDDGYVWMRVPTSRLSSSGGVMAGNNCATSDAGQYALVSAQLPYGSYNIYSVAFTATGPKGPMTVIAGNTNLPALVPVIRGGNESVATIALSRFERCQQRRDFQPNGKRVVLECNPNVQVQGQYVVFMAEQMTVCNVMVCAQQMQYMPNGTPLTPEAAVALQKSPGSLLGGEEECPGGTIPQQMLLEQ